MRKWYKYIIYYLFTDIRRRIKGINHPKVTDGGLLMGLCCCDDMYLSSMIRPNINISLSIFLDSIFNIYYWICLLLFYYNVFEVSIALDGDLIYFVMSNQLFWYVCWWYNWWWENRIDARTRTLARASELRPKCVHFHAPVADAISFSS